MFGRRGRSLLSGAALCAAAGWTALGIAPWRPWDTRETLEPDPETCAGSGLDCVTVLIPARNEAAGIERTLAALRRQGPGLRVILVDDQSADGTADRARAVGGNELTVISGKTLPEGWSGKLWALEQGLQLVRSPLALLLDADIELLPGTVAALARKLEAEKLDLVSVMAELRTQTGWEKLLVPAFVYFFKLLYPFSIGNRAGSKMGVAAGGCILVRTEPLRALGGFKAIRDALIDDCALAAALKREGNRTWVGLSHAVRSHRPYPRLGDFWGMVARTAFTQLRYSPLLLAGTTLAMLLFFGAPPAALLARNRAGRLAGLLGTAAMAGTYAPMIRFYRLPWWRTFTLPPAGFLYLVMTWSSAWHYWRGRRSAWKGRVYAAGRKPAVEPPAGPPP